MKKAKVETKTTKEINQGGRPETKIDWEQFDKLCMLQCTQKEIASFFDCTDDTIQNIVKKHKNMSFSDYYAQKSQKGKIAIRRKMFQNAESGNTSMLIWLSKQYLGMREQVENHNEVQKIEFKIVSDD